MLGSGELGGDTSVGREGIRGGTGGRTSSCRMKGVSPEYTDEAVGAVEMRGW